MLEFYEIIDVEVVYFYLALEFCINDGEEGLYGDLQGRPLLFNGDFLSFVEGWVDK